MRRPAFSLIELLVAVGIIAVLIAILLPVAAKVREAGRRTQCASNLRQIGAGLHHYFNDFKSLPVRWNGLETNNPHVFKYKTNPEDVSEAMLKYVGPKPVFYCPSNNEDRDGGRWWPYDSGTIAVTYQFPFWLTDRSWLIEKPDYSRLHADRVLATDVLASSDGANDVVLHNHPHKHGQAVVGMNMLFADGRVEWNNGSSGWVMYGWYEGQVFWHYAQY